MRKLTRRPGRTLSRRLQQPHLLPLNHHFQTTSHHCRVTNLLFLPINPHSPALNLLYLVLLLYRLYHHGGRHTALLHPRHLPPSTLLPSLVYLPNQVYHLSTRRWHISCLNLSRAEGATRPPLSTPGRGGSPLRITSTRWII